MTPHFNLNSKIFQKIPSMISYKDYYMNYIGTKETNLDNGWGWFIDLELNSEPLKLNTYRKKYTKIIYPKTIKEFPNIRSMKSISNFNDQSMVFEMDEEINHRTNNNLIYCLNYLLRFIGFMVCYYIIILLV